MSNVFEDLSKSMQEFIEHEKGQRKLNTKTVEIVPLESMSAPTIKMLRQSLSMSQAVFADVVGVSKKTVEAWEAGKNKPNGPSLRFLQVIRTRPDIVDSIYSCRK